MRRVVVAVALVLAACSSSPKSGGDGGSGGTSGGGSDLAMSGPPDLAPRNTLGLIACGAASCTAGQQFCCSGDSGKTGDCENAPNTMCGVTQFYCDGPEDCPPADHECCAESGLSQCRQPGYCAQRATTTQAYLMCHTTADCGNSGLVCKLAPNGSPYGLCLSP